jgi:hypothetical protein
MLQTVNTGYFAVHPLCIGMCQQDLDHLILDLPAVNFAALTYSLSPPYKQRHALRTKSMPGIRQPNSQGSALHWSDGKVSPRFFCCDISAISIAYNWPTSFKAGTDRETYTKEII